MSLLQRFADEARGLATRGKKAIVAVSGGTDSVALLDLLVRTRELHQVELVVAHLDHGIHPESARVAQQVQNLADAYGIPCDVGTLELGSSAGETEARDQRYAWLEAAANATFRARV